MNSFAYIALGSNLGASQDILTEAATRLEPLSAAPILRSSLWRSSPVDCPPGSPPFVNAVVRISPRLEETPKSLLKKLQEIEKEFGRRKKLVLNEPRPLDLDLVAFGNCVMSSPELTLPHPRAHLRKFVLQPLSEVAADLILPGMQKPVVTLLQALESSERVELLGPFPTQR